MKLPNNFKPAPLADVIQRGYKLHSVWGKFSDTAREKAADLRDMGYFATVVKRKITDGTYQYEVWFKKR